MGKAELESWGPAAGQPPSDLEVVLPRWAGGNRGTEGRLLGVAGKPGLLMWASGGPVIALFPQEKGYRLALTCTPGDGESWGPELMLREQLDVWETRAPEP